MFFVFQHESSECMKYVCEHVVRDSVTTPLPTYGVREWNVRGVKKRREKKVAHTMSKKKSIVAV